MLSFYQKFLSIVNKWTGKAVDYDKAFGYQCVDWAKQFVLEQYGVRLGSFSGSAYTGWKTGSPFDSSWVRVKNSPAAIPQIGDVVFLGPTRANPYGHVCIADNGCTSNKLCIIEENAGNGNGNGQGSNAITRRTISYTDTSRGICLGWFHRK